MQCERQPGGKMVAELGECPAARDMTFDGINYGKNAGRVCCPNVPDCCAILSSRPAGSHRMNATRVLPKR